MTLITSINLVQLFRDLLQRFIVTSGDDNHPGKSDFFGLSYGDAFNIKASCVRTNQIHAAEHQADCLRVRKPYVLVMSFRIPH